MNEERHSLAEYEGGGHDQSGVGGRIGMWIFLFSELMLFGVLFIIYAVYRAAYTGDFHTAGRELNLAMGSFNTFVLITSSFTMVLSIAALQKRDRDLSVCFLIATIALGGLFMLNKFFEWREHYLHGFFPGLESMSKLPHGQVLFFDLYYVMTGLHGLHVIAGLSLLAVMLVMVLRGRVSPEQNSLLENSGLYWHLVDVVWIFLLPLFYVLS